VVLEERARERPAPTQEQLYVFPLSPPVHRLLGPWFRVAAARVTSSKSAGTVPSSSKLCVLVTASKCFKRTQKFSQRTTLATDARPSLLEPIDTGLASFSVGENERGKRLNKRPAQSSHDTPCVALRNGYTAANSPQQITLKRSGSLSNFVSLAPTT